MLSNTKTDPNYRERWGYSFQWTDKHLAQKEIAALRAQYDELGSAALERLQAIIARVKPESKREVNCPFKPELYTVLKEHHHEDEVLQAFWDELHSIPDWVDWKQIERAQKFFARYALANSTAFALQGFIRENSVGLHPHLDRLFVLIHMQASPGIAEVFARTGGFAIKNLLSRVIETFTLGHSSHHFA